MRETKIRDNNSDNQITFKRYLKSLGNAPPKVTLLQLIFGALFNLIVIGVVLVWQVWWIGNYFFLLQISFNILLVLVTFVQIKNKLKSITDLDLKILKFSQNFYSEETAKLCFEPLIADWKKEHSESVAKNRNWNARLVSVRYAYAFLSAMLMQSRIGSLLQIIFKS